MNVNAVQVAQALRLYSRKTRPYVPDLVASIQQRYGFVRVPSAQELIDVVRAESNAPLQFNHGRLLTQDGRTVVIESMQLHSHLVIAITASSTADADLVVDDILATHSEMVATINPRRNYVSQLDVTLDVHLDWASDVASRTSIMVSKVIAGYDPNVHPDAYASAFRLTTLGMQPDPNSGSSGIRVGQFCQVPSS
jgi:hypothetical protein